ncbi:hypothetical protein FACS1894109_14700 [Spirochaetia bacterium]|nr:hypothetical protein FACS1894109_14700 [Spirochaetia bacterium]
MNRKLLLGLALILAASSVFAGGGQSKSSASGAGVKPGTADSPGWMANSQNPVAFDWYVHADWVANSVWGKSKTTQWITKKTGFDVRVITPAGNVEERLNAMIATNTLPDLITINAGSEQYRLLVESGLVEPLNKLADQYDPYFYKATNPVTRNWYTEADGNIYAYPNSTVIPDDFVTYKGLKESGNFFSVRKDMYEAIGSPDMTTPEGFLNALRSAKQRFPTVNGQPLIPLGFEAFNDTWGGNRGMQSGLMERLAQSYEVNGKYDDPDLGPNNSEYIRWLKAFRQATVEGLIPTDIFVDKRPQIMEKIAQGRYFASFIQMGDYYAGELAFYESGPDHIYIGVNGPLNSRKDPPKLRGVGGVAGWMITMIPKNCKDKARALQLMTYLISEEGQRDNLFGIPGDMYTMVDGKPKRTPEHLARLAKDRNATMEEWGGSRQIFFLYSEPYEWVNQDMADLYPFERQLRIFNRDNVVSYAQYAGVTNFEAGSNEAIAYDEIRRQWGQVLPRLLHASSDAEFDRIWNEYQKFKADHKYDLIQTKATELLNINKKKIGTQ